MTLKLTYAGFNYVADVDGSYVYSNSLPALVSQTGSNSVALTEDYGIDPATNTAYADYTHNGTLGNTDTIADLEAQATAAKQAGLTVIFRPLIDFTVDASAASLVGGNGNVYANGDWRADYNPGSVANGIAFLKSYEQAVLLPQAMAAQAVGAQILDIGTELDQLTGPAYKAEWDSIITDVRAVYSGRLTYSAIGNDDLSPWQYAGVTTPPPAGTGDVVTQVSFWNELDAVGIDEYSSLSNANDTALNGSAPTLQQLVNAWEQPFADDGHGTPTDITALQTHGKSLIQYYESIAAATGKPLLFTEIGYNSAPDAAFQPFYTSSNSYDPALQAELYQAFFQAWQADGNTSLQGVWLWDWEPAPNAVGAGTRPSWTPQANAAALSDIKTAFLADESPACFLRGTRIAVPGGETEVQELTAGHLVCTAGGSSRPIRWIGTRSYAARLAGPRVRPILFPSGSLGAGLPRRDMYLSPEHALLLDGLLVPALQLCNGTIRQIASSDRIDYFHIELDDHDVLVAEGVAAESFVDDGSRAAFSNAADYPFGISGIPHPALYCAPRVEQGFALEAIRRRIAASRTEPLLRRSA